MHPIPPKQALALAILLGYQALGAPTLQKRDDACSKGPFNPDPVLGDSPHGGNWNCETK